MNILFRTSAVVALALFSYPTYAEQSLTCPADHHSVGQKPPAGYEWQCVDQNGLVDGPSLTWYDNGQLMSERHMKHGKEHGRQRSWWPNGQLMMEGISVDGHRYKGFKYWSITGAPTELQVETETVTKKLDRTGQSVPAEKSTSSVQETRGAKP